MTTIIDVAKRANVSTATVSNAFNKPQRVKAETRKRVLAVAAEMNFQPNLHASGLRSQRTGIVGIVVSDIRFNYSAVVAHGIQEELRRANRTGLIANTDGSHQKTRAILRELRQQGVRSFILSPAQYRYDEETLQLLREMQASGIHLAFVSNEMASFSADVVLWNAQEGTKQMVRHLVEQGHHQIAFVRLALNRNTAGLKRWFGFQEGMIEAGLPLIPEYIFEGKMNFETGVQALDHFRQLPEPPTAIFAIDDIVAAGVINRCYHLGIRVPHDLSVVGIGDLPIAQHLSPALTTIGVDIEQMGRKAAELLLERLDNGELPPRKHYLDYQLIVRESSAEPKSR
ncbi:MAG: LacI family DNA-binding transcriptional regulator [Chloroflexota bacterium]